MKFLLLLCTSAAAAPNIMLSIPSNSFPFLTNNPSDVPLPIELLDYMFGMTDARSTITTAGYESVLSTTSLSSFVDMSKSYPNLDFRQCIGNSGVFNSDCVITEMAQESSVRKADLSAPLSIVIGENFESALPILRDRNVKIGLAAQSTIIVASEFSVNEAADVNGTAYLTEYLIKKYPVKVSFIPSNIAACVSGLRSAHAEIDILNHFLNPPLDSNDRAGLAILYALNSVVIPRWNTDTPFSGVSAAGCFNTFEVIDTLEQLFLTV